MNEPGETSTDLQAATDRVRAVKEVHEGELLSKANVVGVGIGYRQVDGETTRTPALVVMVSRKMPPSQVGEADLIPHWLDGVPVDVQEVGEIRAL